MTMSSLIGRVLRTGCVVVPPGDSKHVEEVHAKVGGGGA